MDKLEVTLVVADEGIKQLRGAWIKFSFIKANNTTLSILITVLQSNAMYNKVGRNIITQKQYKIPQKWNKNIMEGTTGRWNGAVVHTCKSSFRWLV